MLLLPFPLALNLPLPLFNSTLPLSNPQIKNSKQIVLSMFQCLPTMIDKQQFQITFRASLKGSLKEALENGYRDFSRYYLIIVGKNLDFSR